MARQAIPAPVQTPATEPIGGASVFTAPWRKFLQIISDLMVSATRIDQTSDGVKYTQNGSIVCVNYYGNGGSVRLPFAPAFSTAFDVWNGSTWSRVDATANPDGTFSVILPNGTGIRMQGAYIFNMTGV